MAKPITSFLVPRRAGLEKPTTIPAMADNKMIKTHEKK
jgi:hypothetical protein